MSTLKRFWGDLHNHCDISYGHGSLERALAIARQQLDFVSITGHAFWPDIPTDRERFGPDIDYHLEGFRKLERGWDHVQDRVTAAQSPGKFITFLGYEWHSFAHGDHHVLRKGTRGPLITGRNLDELTENLRRAGQPFLLVPHHTGYLPGGRGINWDTYSAERSPIVEVYSLHGCSESDEAPYPMLNSMGPRDSRATTQAGLARGHRFGFVGSTDHHAGYPGSHGEGRLAVDATELTHDAIWEALLQRRTYAVTGDRIQARFSVNGVSFGGETTGSTRHLSLSAEGSDLWDTVEIIKNGRVWRRFAPTPPPDVPRGLQRAKLRVEWGWSRPDRLARWNVRATLEDGRILGVESCFRGEPIVRHDEISGVADTVPHEILSQDSRSVAWRSETRGNLSMRHATTQSLILHLEMPDSARIRLEGDAGGGRFSVSHTLAELLEGSRGHFSDGFITPALSLHRALPEAACAFSIDVVDDAPELPVDTYYVRMAQRNGQMAWITPVWVRA